MSPTVMRTYQRKVRLAKPIEGVQSLCRLCLSQCSDGVPIFDDKPDGLPSSLSFRIMVCVGLQITQEESLPNHICIECNTELERSYTFRKKCESSYQKLKFHSQTFQNNSRKPRLFGGTAFGYDEDHNIHNVVPQETFTDNGNEKSMEFTDSQHHTDSLQQENIEMISQNDELNSQISQIDELKNQISQNDELNNQSVMPHDFSSKEQIESDTPDITQFLSSSLAQLGVVNNQGDRLFCLEPRIDVRVEMGNGEALEFVMIGEGEITSKEKPLKTPRERRFEEIMSQPQEKENKEIEDSRKVKKTSSSTGRKSSRCGLCGRWFSSPGALSRHARLHTGARPHVCSVCARPFAQRAELRRHEFVHQASRPFQCAVCPKSYTQRAALAAHARGHRPAAARPLLLHPCHRCDKVFLYQSGLSRHLSSHLGRVFPCGGCRRLFSDKSSLTRHRRTACCT